LLVNPDGSVDVYFGPKPPTGKEANWVQTIPGKGWNTLLRLCGEPPLTSACLRRVAGKTDPTIVPPSTV
jgi:hypothetical protein